MSIWKITLGALALGLMVTAAASPGLAKSRNTAAQDWRNARAEAIPNSDMTLGGSRALAIHECNSKTASLKDYTWGDDQSQRYRSCMAEHGQIE
jgi:hypothetical protein